VPGVIQHLTGLIAARGGVPLARWARRYRDDLGAAVKSAFVGSVRVKSGLSPGRPFLGLIGLLANRVR